MGSSSDTSIPNLEHSRRPRGGCSFMRLSSASHTSLRFGGYRLRDRDAIAHFSRAYSSFSQDPDTSGPLNAESVSQRTPYTHSANWTSLGPSINKSNALQQSPPPRKKARTLKTLQCPTGPLGKPHRLRRPLTTSPQSTPQPP